MTRRPTTRGTTTHRAAVPKLPSFIQDQIDCLIEKGKQKGLTAPEQANLAEVLDYVDDMTILALRRARRRSA